MAKTKKTETVETPKVVEQPKVETLVMETPKPKKDKWEIKDRMYVLRGNKRPLSKIMKSCGIYWFDEELGSKVSNMTSKELKRDLLVYAKRNPGLFLELVNDDNVVLRNFGIRATEMGIISLSPDQRTFTWTSNKRKLMNVPFDEHPYSALAAWFKTDEGMEIYSNIEKRFNS